MASSALYDRLFCFGMPKCGTTTVAALLDMHPAICMHRQKEPGDFLRPLGYARLSGYAVTPESRWLADFTTAYGLTPNRDQFFTNLRAAGLDPAAARFIVCLRDPAGLACSFLGHVAERWDPDVLAETDTLRARILAACDYVGALERLSAEVDAAQIFVVRFDDLSGPDMQAALIAALFEWLEVPPIDITKPIWENAGGSATRYPSWLQRLADLLHNVDLVRNLSPSTRARLRRLVSQPSSKTILPESVIDETLTWLAIQPTVQRSRTLFNSLRSGPLDRFSCTS